MNRIDIMFQELKNNKKAGLFLFLPAGYPDIETTERLICKMVDLGVNLIEIGVPFSDPIADGPVIQEASTIALQNDINLDKIFDMVERLRKRHVNVPLVLMSYFNPILKLGIENVVQKAQKVGVDGFIVPDLLPFADDNSVEFNQTLKKFNLHQIFLASIITEDERLEKIVDNTTGFLYLISKLGVTGISKTLELEPVQKKIEKIKKIKDIPVALGFGISTKEQVLNIAKSGLDAIIIGSALTKLINSKNDDEVIKFIKEIKSVM